MLTPAILLVMSDHQRDTTGSEIRALRLTHGLSQQEVASALDISAKTVSRLERQGHGHHLRRVRSFLESLAANNPAAGVSSVRSFIRQEGIPGRPPLALALHEFAALLDQLPGEQKAAAVQTFIEVQRQLDDGTVDQKKTLETAAQVTVKAFSQFLRDENPT